MSVLSPSSFRHRRAHNGSSKRMRLGARLGRNQAVAPDAYTTSTAYHTIEALAGSMVAPSGRRGPLYWPTIARSPFFKAIVVRLAGTAMPSWLATTAAVSV